MNLAELRERYIAGTTWEMGRPGWIAVHIAAVMGLIALGMALNRKE